MASVSQALSSSYQGRTVDVVVVVLVTGFGVNVEVLVVVMVSLKVEDLVLVIPVELGCTDLLVYLVTHVEVVVA